MVRIRKVSSYWESTVCANFVNFTHPSPRLQWVAFSCPFHHIIWAHLPKFLLSPGLILWLKRSYAPGFVISSCCFRRLLNWAKFWYRSVLNGPNIKRTPFIKRTPDYSLNEIELRGWSVRVVYSSYNLKCTFLSVYPFYSSYFKSNSAMFLLYSYLVKVQRESGRVLCLRDRRVTES